MNFSTRLKQARNKKGLTQKELSQLIGISSAAIANYETGISSPKEEILLKLFDALDVDPNFLFQDSFSPTHSQVTPTEQQLLTDYRNLNEDGQEYIQKQMEFASSQPEYKKHSPHETVDKTA